MIFNLNKIREDELDIKMIDAIDAGYKYMDQDIINKLCYGKIKILPLRYDFFTEYYGGLSRQKLSGYSLEELDAAEQKTAVYHFVGIFKPWVCTRMTVSSRRPVTGNILQGRQKTGNRLWYLDVLGQDSG